MQHDALEREVVIVDGLWPLAKGIVHFLLGLSNGVADRIHC